MDCPSIDILERLENGNIPDSQQDQLLLHLSTCENCLSKMSQQDESGSDENVHDDEILAALQLKKYAQEEHCQQLLSHFNKQNTFEGLQPNLNEQSATALDDLVIDDFHLIRRIAEGGMGVVYEAEQLSLKRRVAVKLLSNIGTVSDQQLQRFRNESLAAAHLDHPNIVPILSMGETKKYHYLVMKLITGSTLAELIGRLGTGNSDPNATPPSTVKGNTLAADISLNSPSRISGAQPIQPPYELLQEANARELSPDSETAQVDSYSHNILKVFGSDTIQEPQFFYRVAEQFIQVAEGLHYAHDRGIVHRDIKPSNLLIDQTGRFWISDFGIAKFKSPDDLTMTGAIIGTPRYMSPEQARGTKGLVDHRTDIYSLGVTLYELLTLKPIFEVDRQDLLYVKIAEEDPIRPYVHNPAIPVDLETILLKSINKEITERYSTATEMADDLKRFIQDEPILAKRAGCWERSLKWSRRHKAFTTTFLSVTLVCIIALMVMTTMMAVHNHRQQELLALAKKSQLELKKTLYFSKIKAAGAALNSGDTRQVTQILNDLRPMTEETDFRGGEWYYLWNQVHNSRKIVSEFETPIYVLRFSPDGHTYATSGLDAVIRIYESSSGQLLLEIESGQLEVNGLSFSPDGGQLASAGDDGTIRVWKIDWYENQANQVLNIKASDNIVFHVLFNHNGNTLISVGEEPVIKLWDAKTGIFRGQLAGHTDSRINVALSPVENQIASVAKDDRLIVWDLSSLKPVFDLPFTDKEGFGRLTSVVYSPDGSQIAISSTNKQIQVRDRQTGVLIEEFRHSDEVHGVLFSPDGKVILSRDYSGMISVWPIGQKNQQENRSWKAHGGRVYFLAISPINDQLLSGGEDGLVLSWNYKKTLSHKFLQRHDCHFDAVEFISLSEGERLVTLAHNEIELWNPKTGHFEKSLTKTDFPLNAMTVSSDCSTIAAGGMQGDLCLYDVTNRRRLFDLKIREGFDVYQMALSPNGNIVAATCITRKNGSALYVYNRQTSQRYTKNLPEECNTVKFSDDGKQLYLSGAFNTLVVWDVDSQEILCEHKGHSHPIMKIQTSSRHNLVATSSEDRLIKIWAPDHWVQPTVLGGHKACVNDSAFSPNNHRLISCGDDCQLKIWSIESGFEQELLSINYGKIQPLSVCFSKEGRYLACMLDDNNTPWTKIQILNWEK